MSRALRGRGREAARNDELILAAARDVFIADPDAPVSAVADRAGVGIAAVYRRFASKEDMLRRLCFDGLRTYNDIARAAVADTQEPWSAFAGFMAAILDADTHSLTINLAGRFTPTAEMRDAGTEAQRLNRQIVARAHAAGVLRGDVVDDDLSFVFEQLAAVHGPNRERTRELRRRYLALHLDALRAKDDATPLPGSPPTWQEQAGRWEPR
jgi:AcrR family transcriptional regulator